jgi:hypothetical protein
MVLGVDDAALIAMAIGAAAKAGGEAISGAKAKKAAKRKMKEERRETYGSLADTAEQERAELAAHRLGSRARAGKRRAGQMQDTAEVVRGALNI